MGKQLQKPSNVLSSGPGKLLLELSAILIMVSFLIMVNQKSSLAQSSDTIFSKGQLAKVDNQLVGKRASQVNSSSAQLGKIISLDLENVTLERAIKTIAKKAGLKFSYSEYIVPISKKVSIINKRITVNDAIWKLLEDTNLRYVVSPNGFLVLLKWDEKTKYIKDVLQSGVITGTVVDATTGETLPGANVFLESTQQGASTDMNGNFEITNIEPGTYTLVARFVGFQIFEQEITVDEDETVTLTIELQSEMVGLDELVVTGTAGEVRKRELGTSIDQFSSDDLEAQPVGNMEEFLRSSGAGIQSLAVSGQVGAGGTIKLRGTTSISQGNSPLIFINGVRLSTNPTPPPNLEDGRGPRIISNPLNYINPEDVASMEVIKGAAATTLYGTEASSGVIQIFTRQGEDGRTQGSFSVTSGVNFWPQLSDAIDSHPTDLDLNKVQKNGFVQRYNASVRGGSEDLTYFVSARYTDEEGIVETQNSKGSTISGNFTFDIADNLKVAINNTYNRQNTRYVPDSNNRHGYILNVLRLDKGYSPGSRDNSWVLETELRSKVDNFISGASIEHQIGDPSTNGLKNHFRFGLNQVQVSNSGLLPFGYLLNPQGTINAQSWQNRVITAEYIGNWQNQVSERMHSTLSFGAQYFDEFTHDINSGGIGFSGPGNQTVTSAARTFGSEDEIREVNAGFFLQERIGIDDILYLIGGIRADGNSSFGNNYGFEYYPKFSASYVLSDSDFWDLSWWNSLRLRGAIGFAGKAPGAFDAVRTWSSVSGLDGQPAVTPNNLGNPELGPERTREIEFGFDADFVDSRVTLEATFFDALTSDALFPVLPSPSTGIANSQLRNVGELSSKGIELSSEFIPIRSQQLQWAVGIDLTMIDEEVTDMGGAASLSVGYEQEIREGYAPPSFFGRRVTNPDEFADPVYEDNAFLGQTFPDMNMIFSTNLDLGESLSVSARGELSKGGHMVNATAFLNTARGYWPPTQELQEIRETQGIEALTAAERSQLSGFYGYDQFIESADFFKLRSVTLRYRVPIKWLPNGVRSSTLSITGSNLIKISDYSGLDPEVIEGGSSGTENFRRVEYYTLPPNRSVNFKLNVTF